MSSCETSASSCRRARSEAASAAARVPRSPAIRLNACASALTSSPPASTARTSVLPSPRARAACSSKRRRLCAGRKINSAAPPAPIARSSRPTHVSVGPSSRRATNTGGGFTGITTNPSCRSATTIGALADPRGGGWPSAARGPLSGDGGSGYGSSGGPSRRPSPPRSRQSRPPPRPPPSRGSTDVSGSPRRRRCCTARTYPGGRPLGRFDAVRPSAITTRNGR